MARLIAALPKGEANGLAVLDQPMVSDPETPHLIVALVDCKKLLTDIDTGDVEPYARIIRVEAIEDHEDRATIERLMRAAIAQRTGRPELPLDEVASVTVIHPAASVDPDTGEVLDDDAGE